jgi:hypothetical protein
MTAEIINFRPKRLQPCPYGAFHKALMAVLILADFELSEIYLIIGVWLARGFISEDEASALYMFFGLE